MRYIRLSTVFLLLACGDGGDAIVGSPALESLDESLPAGVHGHFLIGPYAAGRQTVHVVLEARDVESAFGLSEESARDRVERAVPH